DRGVETGNLVIITTASLAAKAKVMAGAHFSDRVFVSGYISTGTVGAVKPGGFGAGCFWAGGGSTAAAAGPLMQGIGSAGVGAPGTPPVVGAPLPSGWQSALLLVKVTARCAWCIEPAAIAQLTGAAW